MSNARSPLAARIHPIAGLPSETEHALAFHHLSAPRPGARSDPLCKGTATIVVSSYGSKTSPADVVPAIFHS